MEWFDITQPIEVGMQRYSSVEDFEFVWKRRYDAGDGMALSRFTMTSHLGTHVDAPYHFVESGGRISDVSIGRLCGSCYVVDARGRCCIDADLAVALPEGCERVLFLTDNTERLAVGGEFENVYLTPGACEVLVDRGIKLVGIDYFSVDPKGDRARTAHLPLLRGGVLILESIRLSGVPIGRYELLCLPLQLVGFEAAPCRAVLRKCEES